MDETLEKKLLLVGGVLRRQYGKLPKWSLVAAPEGPDPFEKKNEKRLVAGLLREMFEGDCGPIVLALFAVKNHEIKTGTNEHGNRREVYAIGHSGPVRETFRRKSEKSQWEVKDVVPISPEELVLSVQHPQSLHRIITQFLYHAASEILDEEDCDEEYDDAD